MATLIPKQNFVDLRDRRVLADELKQSVQLCHKDGRYVTVLCIIVCGIDAFASGEKSAFAHKRDFLRILEKHFPEMCRKLGSRKFYDRYRNGMVHHYHPMKGYVLGQDHDLGGEYVAELEIEGRPGTRTSINMDRLTQDFIKLCEYVIGGGAIP